MNAPCWRGCRRVHSQLISSVVEGDHVAIHWVFELTDHAGKTLRIDEVALQQWRRRPDLARAVLL